MQGSFVVEETNIIVYYGEDYRQTFRSKGMKFTAKHGIALLVSVTALAFLIGNMPDTLETQEKLSVIDQRLEENLMEQEKIQASIQKNEDYMQR